MTSDRRFSRAALVGRDFPRITPAPIAQAEAINLVDAPALNRVRKLVVRAFTTPRVEALRPWTQAAADTLVDRMAAAGGLADVMAHLADELPLMTICQLMDAPPEDRPQLRRIVHAGGPRILDDLGAHLRLPASMFRYGRATLSERGNSASAVVFDALDRFFEDGGAEHAGRGLIAGSGPGITAEVALGSWDDGRDGLREEEPERAQDGRALCALSPGRG